MTQNDQEARWRDIMKRTRSGAELRMAVPAKSIRLPAAGAARFALVALSLGLSLTAAFGPVAASAFEGPYATLVDVGGGVLLDVDVRWPSTGTPPPGGWPVVFWCHPGGGNKSSTAESAAAYADDGYVTLSYTNRPDGDSSPDDFAADHVALKEWLLDDFETEAGVTVPMDGTKFGITGKSLGGVTSWSGALLTSAFTTAVPFNRGWHAWTTYFVDNGSIERQTAAAEVILGQGIPGEYPAAETQSLLEGALGPLVDALSTLDIPVMNQLAMLDSRVSGTTALEDHLAMTSSPMKILYLGTGGHNTPDSDATFRDELRRAWFDYHLKGEMNGIDTLDPIQMALLVTDEHLSWPAWPPADQSNVQVFLHEGGAILADVPAGAQPSDTLVNDPGSYTWEDAKTDFLSAAALTAAVPKQTLVYETGNFTSGALLVGEPSVELHVSGSASRYQVNAHLFDISDSDDPVLLAFGTAMLDSSPAVASITLSVTGRRIPPGNRLRLEITNRDSQDVNHTNDYGFNQLRFVPFFEYSTTSVFHDNVRPSSLTVPLLGATELPIPDGSTDGDLPVRILKVRGLTRPAGEQRATLRSDAIDATSATFDPVTEGLTLGFSEPGGPSFAVTIPPGDPDWKVSAKSYKWRARSAPHPQGLYSISVGTSGSRFKLKGKARNLNALPITGFSSLELSLQIGDDIWSGAVPPCTLSGSGDSLKCK